MVIPCSVPKTIEKLYNQNIVKATHGTDRLFLFAGDQKIEHLNADFHGCALEAEDPEYLFKIASTSRIGVFATQLGLIARYGCRYKEIPYLVKMNAKTNIASLQHDDPMSYQLTSIADVVRMRDDHNLTILGVGMTVYLGSRYEGQMLAQAARLVLDAHAQGLMCVLWMYPRGKAVKQERSEAIIAGAAGVAHALGADFVKVNPPINEDGEPLPGALLQATTAAGNTGVVCSGGSSTDAKAFLTTLHAQLHEGKTAGAAVGRNIYQKSPQQAVAFCEAIASLIYDNADLERALGKLG
ncbi:aldolase [Candidatus Dependentiae bacterium]|nr:aldolase [Candidatus Dependentiae bacterium]